MYSFGAIVLVRFPFTDLTDDKLRPALVVSRDNDGRADLVFCFITSSMRSGRYSALIDASRTTGLKVRSAVRFDRLATLDRALVAGRLGAASPDWLARHAPTFLSVFGFALTP